MNYQITNLRLAHALSIVGESAPMPFEFESAIDVYFRARFTSEKLRWSILPNPSFSAAEFMFFLKFAFRAGFVTKANLGGANIEQGTLSLEVDQLELTLKGWQYIEEFDQPVLSRWLFQIWNNVPTVVVSVGTSLIIAWSIYWFGSPK